jgi:hypothetical protein
VAVAVKECHTSPKTPEGRQLASVDGVALIVVLASVCVQAVLLFTGTGIAPAHSSLVGSTGVLIQILKALLASPLLILT